MAVVGRVSSHIHSAIASVQRISVLLSTVFIVVPVLFRAIDVGLRLSDGADFFHVYTQVVLADSLYCSSLLAFLYISHRIRYENVGMVIRVIIALIITIYVSDVIIYHVISNRLRVADILLYAKEATVFREYFVLKSRLTTVSLMIFAPVALGLVAICFKACVLRSHPMRQCSVSIIIASVIFALVGIGNREPVVHMNSYALLNMGHFVFSSAYEEQYSDQYKERLLSSWQDTYCLGSGRSEKPNIILVMLESFSVSHSKLFSCLNDWTPNLDRIARENVYFTNFHANGYVTNHALISLLEGKYPLPPSHSIIDSRELTSDNYCCQETLPQYLKLYSYRTVFLTSGDLRFSNKGKWLKSIGFDELHGQECDEYVGVGRYIFNSVPDEYLYDHVLNCVSGMVQEHKPFFMVVENVSSHWPFISPRTGHRSLEDVVRYSDEQLGRLYDGFRSSLDMNNTIIFIVGDHRPPTTITNEEMAIFGARAASLVPAVLVDYKRAASRETAVAQQKDLFSSVKYLVSGRYYLNPEDGNFIVNPSVPPKFLFHSRGDYRRMVNVLFGGELYVVKLDGDNTAILGPVVTSNREIVEKINYERLKATVSCPE